MDSEFDSFDDFVSSPADDGGAAGKKFKPKPKGRPKPRTNAFPCIAPSGLKENLVHSVPTVVDAVKEIVIDLIPPNSIGDSDTFNTANEPHLRASEHQGDLLSAEPSQQVVSVGDGGIKDVVCGELPVSGGDSNQNNNVEQCLNRDESASLHWDPFDDIDLGQSINIACSDRKFRPKLKSCPEKQSLASVGISLSGAVEQSHVKICCDGSHSNRRENLRLRGTDYSGNTNNDVPESCLQDGMPSGNYSSTNVGLDDVRFDFATDEGFHSQSRSSPGKSLNTNEEALAGDMIIESYQCDTREVPVSNVTLEHENPHPCSVDQELNMCDSSHYQAMCGFTGNQHGIVDMDSTTSKPSNIDSGRMEPENGGVCDSELLDGPSIFPVADDYFSVNEHSIYVETAQEILAERADDSAPSEATESRKPSRMPRKSRARSTQPSEGVDGENDDIHGDLRSDSAMSQDVCVDINEGDINLKGKGVKRSRKSAPDTVQQKRSRKKVNDTSSEHNEKPKKKFSRSTKQKKKRDEVELDEAFLAAPDNAIDPEKFSFIKLILRAEFKERDSKKEPTSSSAPATNQRTESPSPWDEPRYEHTYYYDPYQNGDDDPYQNGDYDPNQNGDNDDENVAVHESSSYFNYHSFMKKTPRVAWSKLDTELFYQGIRQFGTDFTLIQQIFPGRTRNQIKLKYKKEERQHPQRITETLENKSNSIAYFQQVIKQLKAANEQENQELSDDVNGAEAYEDNVQEATTELNDNASTGLEQKDVVAKDDADAIDTTTEDQQEIEKVDEDEYHGWDNYTCI